jgi:hypothetical protein
MPLHVRGVVLPKRLGRPHPIRVRFSAPLRPSSPTPRLSPTVPGTWSVSGAAATFTPAQAFPPQTRLTLRIPAGRFGVVAVDGGTLHRTKISRVTTATPPVTFAEQVLARLHYLPVATSAHRPATAAAEADAVFDPPNAHFTWRWSHTPAALTSQWSAKEDNRVLEGAVLAFQHREGLAADGLLGPETWRALLQADRASRSDPVPYTYIYADLAARPQTLTVWKDGSTVISTPTNGGVPGAPTPVGTYPIYERLTSTTMSGTNPDGSHYSDPGVPWVNYFSGGSAVHGFPRASYGSPQSVGCLELPIATAHEVFDTVDYGTLVTVTGD